jgi:NAD(P)-dependent dehydrogenase (short-subunit alcohol dehydrogenase family)
MAELTGKVAIVTGASRGVGAATAEVLAGLGAQVVLAARDGSACERVARGIVEKGGAAEGVACDVADWPAVADLVDQTLVRHGRLDVLANNAGVIQPIARLSDGNPGDWVHSIAVNLVGAYHGARAVLPHFQSQGDGVIVNVSSGAARIPLEGWSAYCAGKAGLAMLTRSLHLETRRSGVRVYGFQPGGVDTDMQAEIRKSGVNRVSRLPRDGLAPADKPARAIAWLCTDAAAPLAGRELGIGLVGQPWFRFVVARAAALAGPVSRRRPA